MAITTMDGLIAALQPFSEDIIKTSFTGEAAGNYFTSLYLAGRPGAAVSPASTINGTSLTSLAGAVPIPAAVAGKSIYLARFEFGQNGSIGAVTLVDRLWHNSGLVVTTTTAQAITPAALPARDNNGTTNGAGVMAAIEVTTTTTNAGVISNMTISYTNELGVSGRTGTMTAFPATAVAGTWLPFNLQAGDQGVRSVQSVTLGTSLVTGTVSLVLYREIVGIGVPLTGVNVQQGPIELALPLIYDNSVLHFVFCLTATAGGSSNGQLTFAQG